MTISNDLPSLASDGVVRRSTRLYPSKSSSSSVWAVGLSRVCRLSRFNVPSSGKRGKRSILDMYPSLLAVASADISSSSDPPPDNNETFHSFSTIELLKEMARAHASVGAEILGCLRGGGLPGGVLGVVATFVPSSDDGTETTATMLSSSLKVQSSSPSSMATSPP